MKIGNVQFRMPWARYVDLPIEEELYYAVRKSIATDIYRDIVNLLDATNDINYNVHELRAFIREELK